MQEGLVSVVVPVYNVEKYLNRCVESIVIQTYKNIEIILVDDGSTDSCPQKCDEWKEKDHRIKVIHKQNAGAGYARNTGIENANGQYLLFADSDDYMAAETVESLFSTAVSTKADLVLCGHRKVSSNGKITKTAIPDMAKSIYTGKEVTELVLPALFGRSFDTGKNSGLSVGPVSCLYSMELIEETGWSFVSEREYVSEDMYSLLCLYSSVKSVAVVSRAFYYYCTNENSLSCSFRPERFSKFLTLYEESMKLCDEYNYSEAVRDEIAAYVVGNNIGTLKMVVTSNEPFEQRMGYIREMVNSPKFQQILSLAGNKGDSPLRRILLNAIKKRLSISVYLIVYSYEIYSRIWGLK